MKRYQVPIALTQVRNPCCCCYYCTHIFTNYRQYPPNTTKKFLSSTESLLSILPQATTLLNAIKDKPELAKKMRASAQEGDYEKVTNFIKETGVTSQVKVTFNPDQFTILLYNFSGSITLKLPW